jgi:50S ribosomal protein L16 3-hydroxylase
MRQLADARALGAAERAQLSDGAQELVQQWLEDGWAWPTST